MRVTWGFSDNTPNNRGKANGKSNERSNENCTLHEYVGAQGSI